MATFLFLFIHVQVQFLHQFNHNTASDLFSVHFRCGFIQGFILLSFSFSSISSLPFFLFLFNLGEALQVIVKHLMVFTLFQFIPTKNFLATQSPIDCSPNFHSKWAWIGTEANKPPLKHQAFLFKSGVKEFRLMLRRGIPLSVRSTSCSHAHTFLLEYGMLYADSSFCSLLHSLSCLLHNLLRISCVP